MGHDGDPRLYKRPFTIANSILSQWRGSDGGVLSRSAPGVNERDGPRNRTKFDSWDNWERLRRDAYV